MTVATPSHPDWFHFIARSGQTGHAWVDELRHPRHQAVIDCSARALLALRAHRLTEGATELDIAEEKLAALAGSPASILHVLHRIVLPVRAYHRYCLDDFESAEHLLALAVKAVEAAITEHLFLLPLADSCLDFAIQGVRIERRRRRWSAMSARIGLVLAMANSRRPFCQLADGSAVDLDRLRGYYLCLGLPQADQQKLAYLLEDSLLAEQIEQLVRSLCLLPEMVVPYR